MRVESPQLSSQLVEVYALEEPPHEYSKSIFLAGPTPRDDSTQSWRKDALRILEAFGYNGVVYIPEGRSGQFHGDYYNQIEWEKRNLARADSILFWIPRNLDTLPGFTTNIEFGMWASSGKVILGCPSGAVKNRYLIELANDYRIPVLGTLEETVRVTLSGLEGGALRSGGERDVPLHVWRTESFQEWYRTQVNAGNTLDGGSVISVFPEASSQPFLWMLHAQMHVGSENRVKSNEVVIGRTRASAVAAYHKDPQSEETRVILVREYRSPSTSKDSYVRELPGGSSPYGESALQTAVTELAEETGVRVSASRMVLHGVSQTTPTLLSHKTTLYSVELTSAEMLEVQAREGEVNGIGGERCILETRTLSELTSGEVEVDWGTLGMILSVLR